MSSNQDDIMAFLDAKFGKKPESKKTKKQKQKSDDKKVEPQISSKQTLKLDQIITDSIKDFNQTEQRQVSEQVIYNKVVQNPKSDGLGKQALQEFHLKEGADFDEQVRNKIFFIGKNSLGNNNTMGLGADNSSDDGKTGISLKQQDKNTKKQQR